MRKEQSAASSNPADIQGRGLRVDLRLSQCRGHWWTSTQAHQLDFGLDWLCLWFPRHIHLARCMALGWVLWGHKYDVICVFPSLRLSPSIELVMLSLQFLLTCSKQLLKAGARIKRLCPLWFHLSTIWEKQWMDWEVGHLPAPSDSVSSHSLVATSHTNMSTLLHSKTKVYKCFLTDLCSNSSLTEK